MEKDLKLEKKLHKQFKEFRMVGEWFGLTNEKKEHLLKTLDKIGIFNG